MKQKCLACGVEKDTEIKEVYPYPEEDGFFEEPMDPLIAIDCQGPRVGEVSDWRFVIVCHQCFHKLNPDMWIDAGGWRWLNPVTPFEQLPKLYGGQQV